MGILLSTFIWSFKVHYYQLTQNSFLWLHCTVGLPELVIIPTSFCIPACTCGIRKWKSQLYFSLNIWENRRKLQLRVAQMEINNCLAWTSEAISKLEGKLILKDFKFTKPFYFKEHDLFKKKLSILSLSKRLQ